MATGNKVGYWWLALTALAIAVYAPLPYLTTPLKELGDAGLAAHYAAQPPWIQTVLYIHMIGSALALLLCPIQLSRKIRSKNPALHRNVGRLTIAAMITGGGAGAVLAPVSIAGPLGTAGFGTLAILSVTFPLLGLRAIKRKDVATHRRWMTRAFAMFYAGVTLRLGLITLIVALDDFGTAYAIMTFGSWVPNLIVVEWLLRRSARQQAGVS